MSVTERVEKLLSLSDAALRLMLGELSAQEIRTIRAVLRYALAGKIKKP